jgi:hypothetical protein
LVVRLKSFECIVWGSKLMIIHIGPAGEKRGSLFGSSW